MLPSTPYLLLRPNTAVAASSTPFGISWISPIGSNTTSAGSFTFTSQNLGTADATRIIGIGIAHGGTSGVTVTGVTVGGNNATQATSAAATSGVGALTDIWYYADAGALGASANIAVTMSGTQGRCGIAVHRIVGTGAAFSVAAVNNTAGGTSLGKAITIPAGGGVIGVINLHLAAAAGTVTGTNLNIDSNGVQLGAASTVIAAGNNTSGSGSTTLTFSWTGGADAAESFAAFSP